MSYRALHEAAAEVLGAHCAPSESSFPANRAIIGVVSKWTVVGLLGAARLSFGMALLFSPAPTLRFLWPDEEASQASASEIARALGIREAVLGLGILGALMRKSSPKPWLLASAAVDSADMALTLMNYFSFRRGARLATFVAGPVTILLDLYLAYSLQE
jgi:hypothetical protein